MWSEIEPKCPVLERTDAESNLVGAKSASGSVWQESMLTHWDGASAIHSAEETSMASALSVFLKPLWRVTSSRLMTTCLPVT